MPFDGISIKALTGELHEALLDARIDKIHQPEKDELVFTLRQPKIGTCRLLISANPRWARLQLVSSKSENPLTPPTFCMVLRKYLEGGKIKEIRQIDFERIVHIKIEALDDYREWKSKVLVCEFMGKHSNIILINPETGIIIDAIKKYGSDLSSYREVLPGKEYLTPPGQNKINPLTAVFNDFVDRMWGQGDNKSLSSALFNVYSGISPYSSREMCLTAGIDPDMPVGQCGQFEFRTLFIAINALLDNIARGDISPVVIYENHEPLDFAPYTPAALNPAANIRQFSSFNEACDDFYREKLGRVRMDSMKTNLSRNIKEILDKAYRKRFLQEGDLSQAEENKKYQIWGELITAYSHQFKKGDTQAILEDFYSGEPVDIELEPRFNPIQNAQKYFKIYNKSRKAIKHLQVLMARNQEEINYLESVLLAINQADNPAQIDEIVEELEKEKFVRVRTKRSSKPLPKSTPRCYASSDGLDIMVGRNNRQNDLLTLKLSDRNDLWLHAKNIPGTHVILKLPPHIKSVHDIPDASLEEAAALAAHFSKAAEAEKVPVDYTFRYNVRKPAGTRPGMVIYDSYWTIMANPRSEITNSLTIDS